MPEHCRGSQYGISEGKPASAIWIQGKDCDHAQTTATSERAGSRQGFYRHIGGKLYYVYPTATKDRILVGNQVQYDAYKQALVAYGLTTSPDFVEETHGPHRILVQQFDGFGPLGD